MDWGSASSFNGMVSRSAHQILLTAPTMGHAMHAVKAHAVKPLIWDLGVE